VVEVETRRFPFKKKNFWFADKPFDVTGCDAVFFYATPSNDEVEGFDCAPSPTFIIDLSEEPEALKKAMSKTCRYEVNRALREGLVVEKNQDHAAFFDLYRKFVDAKDFDGDVENYKDFVSKGNLYTCYYENQLLGGFVSIEDETRARWLLSGSQRLTTTDKKLSKISGLANRLFVWEAMRDAQERGKLWFDLGGYYDGDDKAHPGFGIAHFKRGFGGRAEMLYKYSKYYSLAFRLMKRLKSGK